MPQKARAVLTFRCNSHAPHRRVGCGGRAEAAGGALEGPRLEKRSWWGQYFSELKCRQNLRLSIGLRPSLLAFHTTMSTASVAARNSFDLGAVGRRGRGRLDDSLSSVLLKKTKEMLLFRQVPPYSSSQPFYAFLPVVSLRLKCGSGPAGAHRVQIYRAAPTTCYISSVKRTVGSCHAMDRVHR